MKKYKVILWDIDDTLLDFKKSEKQGIETCFKNRGLYIDDGIAKRYSEINEEHWKRLEKGELTKLEVQRGRFVQLFNELGVNAGIDIEEMRLEYENLLGDIWFYKEDSDKVLKKVEELGYAQYAITNGTKKVQDKKLTNSGLEKFFEQVFISDVIGVQKPGAGFFEYVLKSLGDIRKEEILIVGDSLSSDMQGGVIMGIDTCWYNPNQQKNTYDWEVTYEIRKLADVIKVLED